MSNVNYQHKHIFIHVPKTAGTSMEVKHFVGGESHATASALKAKVGDAWDKFFTWGFVREPMDRIVSAFFHQPNLTSYPQTKAGFKRFVGGLYKAGIDPEYMVSHRSRWHHHFIPQNYFLCDENGNILVDFVGRFSQLQEDWDKVCWEIGFYDSLDHLRKSDHAPFKEYYDNITEKRVRRLYAKDYKIFERF